MAWRVAFSAFIVLIGSVVAIPAASATSGPGDYRYLDGFDFDAVTGLEISEAENRVVVTGDDRVEILQLDDFSTVATVSAVYGVVDPRILGGDLFVAGANDGIIRRIRLSDGVILESWSTEQPLVSSIAVTPDVIWFAHGPDQLDAGIGRIDRATGTVETIGISPRANALVRVALDRPDEVYVGHRGVSPMSIYRYEVDGTMATQLAKTPHGPTGSNLKAFEIADDGSLAWSASGAPYRLIEMTGDTLQLSPRTYDGIHYPDDVALEPTANELVLLATAFTDTVFLFDVGVPTARNTIEFREDVEGTALSTKEIFVVSGIPGSFRLQAFDLDYDPQPLPLRVVIDGHGRPDSAVTYFSLRCGFFSINGSAVYSEYYDYQIPAGERSCTITHDNTDTLASQISLWDGEQWIDHDNVTTLMFDPAVYDAVGLFDYFRSPQSDLDLFVEQQYRDIAGRAPTQAEHDAAVGRVVRGEIDVVELTLELLESEGHYSTSVAPVARLYRAFFLREPDATGLAYWVQVHRSGVSLPEIAEQFVLSREFELMYGSLDDYGFLDLIYQNVLDRSADGPGYAYWIREMGLGLSRGGVMTWFSESLEFKNKTDARIFVDFVVTRLVQRASLPFDHDQLGPIYRNEGAYEVVRVVLASTIYFNRFWIPRTRGYLRAPTLERFEPTDLPSLPALID